MSRVDGELYDKMKEQKEQLRKGHATGEKSQAPGSNIGI